MVVTFENLITTVLNTTIYARRNDCSFDNVNFFCIYKCLLCLQLSFLDISFEINMHGKQLILYEINLFARTRIT